MVLDFLFWRRVQRGRRFSLTAREIEHHESIQRSQTLYLYFVRVYQPPLMWQRHDNTMGGAIETKASEWLTKTSSIQWKVWTAEGRGSLVKVWPTHWWCSHYPWESTANVYRRSCHVNADWSWCLVWRTVKGWRFYANKLVCHSFKYVDRSHETPESVMGYFIVTEKSVAIVSMFAF